MNRKLKVGIVAGAVAVVLGGAVVAWGASSGSHGPERARQFVGWRVDDALDDINATDAQRAKAHALKDRLFDQGMKLRDSKEEIRAALIQQLRSDRPDPAEVHALVDRMVDQVRGFAHQAADAAIEFHQELTPEQRAEVLRRAEQHHGRHRH
jgi:periplasmic protein CpxP/Spy